MFKSPKAQVSDLSGSRTLTLARRSSCIVRPSSGPVHRGIGLHAGRNDPGPEGQERLSVYPGGWRAGKQPPKDYLARCSAG
jgi:hypothetical protein